MEHTDRVIYLEDNDIAAVRDGTLSIHRITKKANEPSVRDVVTLRLEVKAIMKGKLIKYCYSTSVSSGVVILYFMIFCWKF